MPAYPQEIIEEVRQGNDIVDVIGQYLPLRQRGGSYFGLCPFHREKSPSFSVSPDRQMFHCFGCGAGGNVLGFIMRIENYGFVDALKHLADRIHYTLPEAGYSKDYAKAKQLKNDIYEINKQAARFFYDSLNAPEGARASAYLGERRISAGARRKFGLGAAPPGRDAMLNSLLKQGHSLDLLVKAGLAVPDRRGGHRDRFINRLMFPIFDPYDNIVGFGGRILDNGEPKYLNSPDTPVFDKSRNLYSINFARRERAEEIILVEGYMDVISVYQQGFHNVTAALGTAFNPQHARVLKRYCKTAVALFDSDDAGEKAALRAIPIMLAAGIQVKALRLEGAKDPDEFIQKYGREALAEVIRTAKHHAPFRIDCARRHYDLSDTGQRVRFVNEAAEVIGSLESSVEREVYTREVAQNTGISERAIADEVGARRDGGGEFAPPPSYANKPNTVPDKNVTRGVDEARRNVLYIMASDERFRAKITSVLSAEEFIEDTYARLYQELARLNSPGAASMPADIISLFTDVDEQGRAAAVFAINLEYETEELLIRALNDQIRKIKDSYINKMLEEATASGDVHALQRLAQDKRNLGISYIRATAG